MTCEEAMERIADRLTGDLDAAGLEALREHLEGCQGCASEAAVLQALWDELGAPAAETPSAELRLRFDQMLGRERAGEEPTIPASPRALRGGADRSPQRTTTGLALAAALAVMLGAGVYVGSTTAERRGADDLAELRDEIRALRSTVALALLTEPSASERLSGVVYGRELQTEDRRVADALFERLLDDPNVNVRLAALDALREVVGRPETRARLLESIPEQDSPLVQISAIDVLLELESGTGLARLADDPALDEVVRGYLRDRLERSSR